MKTLPPLEGRMEDKNSACDPEAADAWLVSYEGVKTAIDVFLGGGFLVARSSSLLKDWLMEAWMLAVLMCKNTEAVELFVKSPELPAVSFFLVIDGLLR